MPVWRLQATAEALPTPTATTLAVVLVILFYAVACQKGSKTSSQDALVAPTAPLPAAPPPVMREAHRRPDTAPSVTPPY